MNTHFKIASVLLTFLIQISAGFAHPENKKSPRVYFLIGFNKGVSYDGYVQVRESSYEGTFLKLKEDLGMSSWNSPTMTLGADFSSKNIFEFTYTRHFFDGSEFIPNPTWFNGTLSASSSKGTIDRTIYRGFEGIWKARLFHSMHSNLYSKVAVSYEGLKFYVDAPIDEESPYSETYEAFWRQQLPLPVIGLYGEHHFSKRWSVNAEVSAAYLPVTKTWMNEGGPVYLQQSNFDVKTNLVYKIKFVSLMPGIWYKHYFIKEESLEDENKFQLNGFGYRLAVAFNY